MHAAYRQLVLMLVPVPAGQYNRVETVPGLDSFADRPAELASQSLGPLLAWAKAVIPRRQHPSVPLFLFATAGACLRGLRQAARFGRTAIGPWASCVMHLFLVATPGQW